MKSWRTSQYLIVLLLLITISCELSKEDVESYLSQENYERVYEYVKKQFVNHTTQNNPAFESGLIGLIFSNTSYSTESINLLTSSEYQVSDTEHLATVLWKKAIGNEAEIPEGLHQFLFKNYEVYGSNLEESIMEYYNSDSLFQPLLKGEIRSISLWDKPDYKKLAWLVSFTTLNEPRNYVSEILALNISNQRFLRILMTA